MKTIELTKEHKERLIEMGEKLISPYKFGFENDASEEGIMEFYTNRNNWKFIHWHEFCMNNLASAIFHHGNYPRYKYRDFLHFLTEMIQSSVWYPKTFHIVDYLYRNYLLTSDEAVHSRMVASTNICS